MATEQAVVARTATVYKGGGRTYITKAGAYKRAAVMLIRSKPHDPCDDLLDYDYGGYERQIRRECPYCDYGSKAALKLIKRLARWLKWRDSRLDGAA